MTAVRKTRKSNEVMVTKKFANGSKKTEKFVDSKLVEIDPELDELDDLEDEIEFDELEDEDDEEMETEPVKKVTKKVGRKPKVESAQNVTRISKVVPAQNSNLVAPENRVKDMELQIKILNARVEAMSKVVGKMEKLLAHIANFDSNALISKVTESTNHIDETETEVQPKTKRDPNLTKTGRVKKVLSPEEKAVVRMRFMKGRARKAASQAGRKFNEKVWEKKYLAELE